MRPPAAEAPSKANPCAQKPRKDSPVASCPAAYSAADRALRQSPKSRDAEGTNGYSRRRPAEATPPNCQVKRLVEGAQTWGRSVPAARGKEAGGRDRGTESATGLLFLHSSCVQSLPGLWSQPQGRPRTEGSVLLRAVPAFLAGARGCRPSPEAQPRFPEPHLEPKVVGHCSRTAPGQTPCFPAGGPSGRGCSRGKSQPL